MAPRKHTDGDGRTAMKCAPSNAIAAWTIQRWGPQLTVIDPEAYKEPWVTPEATTKLVPVQKSGKTSADYNLFNDSVFLPVSGAKKK